MAGRREAKEARQLAVLQTSQEGAASKLALFGRVQHLRPAGPQLNTRPPAILRSGSIRQVFFARAEQMTVSSVDVFGVDTCSAWNLSSQGYTANMESAEGAGTVPCLDPAKPQPPH
ncbi:hypothetical protein ABW21_db0200533 [Orbilia brochopaga]|nr:hypothetical protein ABW21_db0200533 [Drechslerella brochopaga]